MKGQNIMFQNTVRMQSATLTLWKLHRTMDLVSSTTTKTAKIEGGAGVGL